MQAEESTAMSLVRTTAEWSAAGLEFVGCALIVLLAAYALGRGLWSALRGASEDRVFETVRQRLVRGILMGLEFLVAADIIHTVAVSLTFESVGVLAIVVVVRTFLSFVLELEMTGKWPWQQDKREGKEQGNK